MNTILDGIEHAERTEALRYPYNEILSTLQENPTGCMSYPYLVLNYPEYVADPARNKLANFIRNLNDLSTSSLGLNVRRINHDPIPYGFGLVNENSHGENSPDYRLETLDQRCRTQAQRDLLDYYTEEGLLKNSPSFVLHGKTVSFPPILDSGGHPVLYHALLHPETNKNDAQNPTEEINPDPELIAFSRKSHYRIFRRLCESGYIDDAVLREMNLSPESMGRYRRILNDILQPYFGVKLEGAYPAGYSIDGDYKYRHTHMINWFAQNLEDKYQHVKKIGGHEYLSGGACWDYLARKFDQSAGTRNLFIYKHNPQSDQTIFFMHNDLLTEFSPLQLKTSKPHLTFIGKLTPSGYQTICIETSESLFQVLQNLQVDQNGNPIISRNSDTLDYNTFKIGKQSLQSSLDFLSSAGIRYEEFDADIMSDSYFPEIWIE